MRKREKKERIILMRKYVLMDILTILKVLNDLQKFTFLISHVVRPYLTPRGIII